MATGWCYLRPILRWDFRLLRWFMLPAPALAMAKTNVHADLLLVETHAQALLVIAATRTGTGSGDFEVWAWSVTRKSGTNGKAAFARRATSA